MLRDAADHLDCCCVHTSVELEADSGIGRRKQIYLEERRHLSNNGRTVATTEKRVRDRHLFLRLVNATLGPAPYR